MESVTEFFGSVHAKYGTVWMIGQVFGMIATILGFISYQVRTKRQLLFMQSSVAAAFCVHYLLIGAYSGMATNAVNILRNVIYDKCAQRGYKSRWIPLIFVAIQCVMCALTWEAWYSVFVLVGAVTHTYCMSLDSPQDVRKSILIVSPSVFTYDVFARSVGGIIYEPVALVSAIVGMLKYRKTLRTKVSGEELKSKR